MAKNLIDTQRLAKELNEYIEFRDECMKKETELPKVPEFVGECILHIAERYAYSYKFNGVPYKDKADMVSTGCISALNAIENTYDASKMKTKSPLSFFMTCIFYGFLGTISKSKKYFDKNNELLESYMDGQVVFDGQQNDYSQQIHSLEPIRLLLDTYRSEKEYDQKLDYAGKHKAKMKAEEKAKLSLEEPQVLLESEPTEIEDDFLDIF